jgi:lipoprotein-releasing system ATP-binding protein
VFQFHHLLSEFNALENIMIPFLIARQNNSNAQEKAYQLLEEVGLKERSSHRPAELSGGEQQRLAVARALANEPKIMIADEPTGNLDRKSSEELVELIMNLKREKGLTFVLATHNLEIARRADFIYHLAEGRVSPKSPAELN